MKFTSFENFRFLWQTCSILGENGVLKGQNFKKNDEVFLKTIGVLSMQNFGAPKWRISPNILEVPPPKNFEEIISQNF